MIGINGHGVCSLVQRSEVLLLLLICGGFICSSLGVVSSLVLSNQLAEVVTHPWQIFSYSIIHLSRGHLLFVLLPLVAMLPLHRRGLWVFWGGVLSGGILFLFTASLFEAERATINGASSGICALLPYSIYYKFRGGERWHHLTAIFLLLFLLTDLVLLFTPFTIGKMAHIGGYCFGVLVLGNILYNVQKEKKRDQEAQKDILFQTRHSGYQSLTEREKRLLQNGSASKEETE